jgi:protein-S-isoprenylcysteine O-methyltransferase Ste14
VPVHLAAGGLLVLAHPSPAGWCAGTFLAATGVALRLWAAGHLVKNHRLTEGGPYAHVRHPLYLGSLLIGLGLGIAAGGVAVRVVVPSMALLFFAYYLPYKERIESARLERRYGARFLTYRERVPALVPDPRRRLRAAGPSERWRLERVRHNREFGTVAAVGLGLSFLALRTLWIS